MKALNSINYTKLYKTLTDITYDFLIGPLPLGNPW